jgi:hypothetical protein
MLKDKILAPKPLLIYQGSVQLKKENISSMNDCVFYSDSISKLNQIEEDKKKRVDKLLSEKEIRGILKRKKKNLMDCKIRIPKCNNPFPMNFEERYL